MIIATTADVMGPASSAHRLFTLNIGGPSLARASRLADYLLSQDLDVIVLTETRPNLGTAALIDELRTAGYEAFWPRPPSAGERGVALLSRSAQTPPIWNKSEELGHRLVVGTVTFPSPVTLIAAYVPSRDASIRKIARKRQFLSQLLSVLSESAHRERTVVMGDLNVVSRDHVPRYSAFRAWEYEVLDEIGELGFVDVFARLHPGQQAHSWIGRTGDGYRYDYVFMSPDLAEAALDCEYVHEARDSRLSDHAGVLLTLGPEQAPDSWARRRLQPASG